MDGLLLIDKPTGVTSFGVVRRVREATGEETVGHTGTLDREATGLLCVMVGRCTKLHQYLPPQDSEYRATIALGERTDTLDREGEVVETDDPSDVDADDLREALDDYVGEIDQRPPAYSAIKIDGERASDRARRDALDEAEIESRRVRVDRLELEEFDPPEATVSVACGPGFYVRALARDVADDVGTCGYATSIRRLAKGSFGLDEAIELEALDAETAGEALLPPREMVRALPTYEVDRAGAVSVGYGQRLDLSGAEVDSLGIEEGDAFAVVEQGEAGDELVAVAVLRTDLDGATLQPRRVLKPSDERDDGPG